jgi:phosphoribosylanthranilate isomerase
VTSPRATPITSAASLPAARLPLAPAEQGHRATLEKTVHVKVCGLTRAADARAARDAGADYLGLVFAESPRRVDVEAARRLVEAVPEAAWVGVFAGWDVGRTLAAARGLGLGTVQLHGDEDATTARDLRRAGLVVWQAFGVTVPADWEALGRRLVELAARVDLVLLDRRTADGMGGRGAAFDWRSAPPELAGLLPRSRLGLSGGLSPANVAEALACLPAALVDASSSLESAPGVKDPDRMRRFVGAARAAGAGSLGSDPECAT